MPAVAVWLWLSNLGTQKSPLSSCPSRIQLSTADPTHVPQPPSSLCSIPDEIAVDVPSWTEFSVCRFTSHLTSSRLAAPLAAGGSCKKYVVGPWSLETEGEGKTAHCPAPASVPGSIRAGEAVWSGKMGPSKGEGWGNSDHDHDHDQADSLGSGGRE